MEEALSVTEASAINTYVGTSESNAADMEGASAPSQSVRIAWLKALAAAIAAHSG